MKNTFLITTLLATTALAVNAYADELTCAGEGDSTCTWSYDATTKTLTITGTGSMKDFGLSPLIADDAATRASYEAQRPWNSIASQVEHVVVSGMDNIGSYAFHAMSNLKSVDITDSVTSINYAAFRNTTSLSSITLPDTLTTIEGWAFVGTAKLQNIPLPTGVTSIGQSSFYMSGLTSIPLTENLTSIDRSAFGKSTSLKALVIPDSVTSLGYTAVWSVSGTVFCASSTLCSGNAMRDFSGTKQIYSIDENGVYKIGDTYYASAEDMSRVTCTGTAASTCSLSPVACTEGYDKCKENALSQMVAKGSLCTTIKGCENLIAMVSDSTYNCSSLTTCRNAVKNGTYTVDLNEGAVAEVVTEEGTHTPKRIYTVEEARAAVEAAGTDTVNVRIRYK